MLPYNKKEAGERLVLFQEKIGLNSRQFAIAIEGDPSYISKMEKGEKGISSTILKKIEDKFNANRQWLLFGTGDPFKYGQNVPRETGKSAKDLSLRKPKIFDKFEPIPWYDVDVAAGGLELYNDNQQVEPLDYLYIPEFSGCSAYNVYGDSMEPLIPKGSKVFVKKIDAWREYLEPGQVYCVGMVDGRRWIKYLRLCKDKSKFTLRSHNTNYEDFEIPKDQIRSIYLVDGWMNKHTQSTFFVLNKK